MRLLTPEIEKQFMLEKFKADYEQKKTDYLKRPEARIECSFCKQEKERVIEFGGNPDYPFALITFICEQCLKEALALFNL